MFTRKFAPVKPKSDSSVVSSSIGSSGKPAAADLEESESAVAADKKKNFNVNAPNYFHVSATKSTETLIAHLIATKTHDKSVTDDSMKIPTLDEHHRVLNPDDTRGHNNSGRTLAIHSVAVDPSVHGRSVGTLLLKDYIQRITSVHCADRLAIIVREKLKGFYERFGFVDKGPSETSFSGGGWYTMTRDIAADEEDEDA